MTQKEVSVAKLARLLELTNFTEQVNLKQKKVCITEINRPALQLHGYFEHFAEGRVDRADGVDFGRWLQAIGNHDGPTACCMGGSNSCERVFIDHAAVRRKLETPGCQQEDVRCRFTVCHVLACDDGGEVLSNP